MLDVSFPTLLFTIINIFVLLFILKKFLFKPVMRVIEEREKMINDQFSQAKDAQDKADSMQKEYEQKLKDARKEAEDILSKAKERDSLEHEAMLERTRQEQEAMIAKSKSAIEADKKQAEIDAQSEIAALAMEAARKIISTKTNKEDSL